MSYSKKSAKRKETSSKYDLLRSPFYRMDRKRDLANLLRSSPEGLTDLIRNRKDLYVTREDISSGKVRQLSIPVRQLRRCHDRIFRLLKRIKLSEYIRCPREKTSAWSNAALHAGAEFITSFDIKQFYPSTTEEHVFRFFHYRLEMSSDVARILALLCTRDGHLPLGSPLSPHLACLVHLDLFEEAAELALASHNTLSVWVDDVTVSGAGPRRDIIGKIKRKAAAKGLQTHKLQRGGGRVGVELTGSFLRNKTIAVANKSHIKIRDLSNALQSAVDPVTRYTLLNRLASMARYQRIIVRQNRAGTERLDSRLNYYRREMRKLDQILSVTKSSPRIVQEEVWDESAPVF